MPIIEVQCYAGYKADEKPVSFILEGHKFMVEKVLNQWRTPDFEYFKIFADDGKGYLLRNGPQKGGWALEKIFKV